MTKRQKREKKSIQIETKTGKDCQGLTKRELKERHSISFVANKNGFS